MAEPFSWHFSRIACVAYAMLPLVQLGVVVYEIAHSARTHTHTPLVVIFGGSMWSGGERTAHKCVCGTKPQHFIGKLGRQIISARAIHFHGIEL